MRVDTTLRVGGRGVADNCSTHKQFLIDHASLFSRRESLVVWADVLLINYGPSLFVGVDFCTPESAIIGLCYLQLSVHCPVTAPGVQVVFLPSSGKTCFR